MTQYKIIFDRAKCIGAFNCVAAAPDFWKTADDGKVNLEGSKQVKKGMFEVIIDEKDFKKNDLAAKTCPVKAIIVEKL